MTDPTPTSNFKLTPLEIITAGLALLLVGSYFSESHKPIKVVKKPIAIVKKDAECKLNKIPTAVIQVSSADAPKKDTSTKTSKNFKRHNRGAFPGDK